MTATNEELSVRYEGPGVGGEIWGGTQANFLVVRTGHSATEVAVMLNDNAAAFLAVELGQELTPAFRKDAARVAGRAWIVRRFARIHYLEPSLVISRATFTEDPGLLADLKSAAS